MHHIKSAISMQLNHFSTPCIILNIQIYLYIKLYSHFYKFTNDDKQKQKLTVLEAISCLPSDTTFLLCLRSVSPARFLSPASPPPLCSHPPHSPEENSVSPPFLLLLLLHHHALWSVAEVNEWGATSAVMNTLGPEHRGQWLPGDAESAEPIK